MMMNELITLLEARLLCGSPTNPHDFSSAFAGDMMSDVLAYGQGQSLLLTGLLNQQVIRTAEMLDMHCIVFVRGKVPSPEVLALAEEKDIAVLSTEYGMFAACGLLYRAGLQGV
ncbi:MAG TPA: hypothetical protein DCP22_06025 [Ruminococcaceae bacterium]|nr:hypothetical protein [Oscillospiraceae bacterium]